MGGEFPSVFGKCKLAAVAGAAFVQLFVEFRYAVACTKLWHCSASELAHYEAWACVAEGICKCACIVALSLVCWEGSRALGDRRFVGYAGMVLRLFIQGHGTEDSSRSSCVEMLVRLAFSSAVVAAGIEVGQDGDSASKWARDLNEGFEVLCRMTVAAGLADMVCDNMEAAYIGAFSAHFKRSLLFNDSCESLTDARYPCDGNSSNRELEAAGFIVMRAILVWCVVGLTIIVYVLQERGVSDPSTRFLLQFLEVLCHLGILQELLSFAASVLGVRRFSSDPSLIGKVPHYQMENRDLSV